MVLSRDAGDDTHSEEGENANSLQGSNRQPCKQKNLLGVQQSAHLSCCFHGVPDVVKYAFVRGRSFSYSRNILFDAGLSSG